MHAACLLCSEISDADQTKMVLRRCISHDHAKQERILDSLSCRSAENSLPKIFARTCGRVYGHMPYTESLNVLLASVICLIHLQSIIKRLYTSKAVFTRSVFC